MQALPLDVAGAASIEALGLSPDDVLERQIVVPRLTADDLARVVQLEVEGATPFGPSQTLAGYRARALDAQRWQVDIALTSRQQVEQRLQADSTGESESEVWVLPAWHTNLAVTTLQPIVLPPYGLARRQRLLRRGRALRMGAALAAVVLLLALALTPTLQLRHRAIAAQRAYDALHQQTAPQVAQRDALTQSADHLRALGALTAEQLDALPVLELLTRVVPDDASLYMLRLEGAKATLSGDANDTAALVQALSRQPGVQTVRLPAPVTRAGRSDKESFTIEVSFDPAAFGRARAATVAKEGA